jgi:glycosyltransferase involved in cell wall biosynthesis
MRILLVGDYPDDARLGSAKVLYKLREEYNALGHECDILFGKEIAARPTNRQVRQALGPLLAARAIAKRFGERGHYDVIDIASAEGFVFGARRRLGAYKNTVFVSRSNGLEHLNYQRMLDDHRAGLLRKPWTRRIWYPAARLSQVEAAARLADKLLLLNEGDREFAVRRKWKSPGDIEIVPHAVSDRFLDESPAPEEPRGGGLLFCGTWDRVKGIDYLVAAFGLLFERGLRVNLTILGGGVSESIIRSSFPDHLQQLITVVPRAPEEEVMRHYRRHDALVFCSTYEGFGMVVVEAMSQRLPVVATPVGCAASLVRDKETGLVVAARDARALADAIARLLEDRAMGLRLADNAFQTVREMTWKNTALKTLDLYSSAAK